MTPAMVLATGVPMLTTPQTAMRSAVRYTRGPAQAEVRASARRAAEQIVAQGRPVTAGEMQRKVAIAKRARGAMPQPVRPSSSGAKRTAGALLMQGKGGAAQAAVRLAKGGRMNPANWRGANMTESTMLAAIGGPQGAFGFAGPFAGFWGSD